MIKFNKANYAENLPDCYGHGKDSVHYKLLEIERVMDAKIQSDMQAIWDALDLEQAAGSTLDLLGASVGQPRGPATDAQYRYMIRAKIMRNRSGGDYPSILQAICYTLACSPSDVLITELDEPCTVEVTKLPLSSLGTAGLSQNQVVAIIKKLLPVCTTIESALFTGTFMFADTETEYDEESGFCDTEDGTIGGYFGDLYSSENEAVLPI